MYLDQRTLLKQLDHLLTYVIMQLAQEQAMLPTRLDKLVYLCLLIGKLDLAIDHEGLPMALYLPLSAGAYLDKLQDQRLDQWLKLLLLQRFSCDCLSSSSVSSHWIYIPIFSYHP